MRAKTIADELDEQQLWHKIVACLLARHGDQRLGPSDFAMSGMTVLVSHESEGTELVLRLLPDAEARRLAEEFQKAARRSN